MLAALALLGGVVLAMLGACGQRAVAVQATPKGSPTPTVPVTQAPVAQTTVRLALPTATTNQAPAAVTGWNQLGGNPQRTHYAYASLPAPSGVLTNSWRVLWVWNGPTGIDTGAPADHLYLPEGMAPVVGDGRLYVGHADGAVRAINATTGGGAWTKQLGGELVNTGAYDPATGAVFFGSTSGRLYKLRASNGDLLGEFNAGAAINQAVLLVGGTVYVGTMAGNLYAVNTTTMTQGWAYPAGAALVASAAYAGKHGGLIFFPSEDGFVHAVRVTDGTRAWRVAVHASQRPLREPRPAAYFPDTYAVVAEAADAVIVRSYFDWSLTWSPIGGAPSSQDEIRQYLARNPTSESLYVFDLDDGSKRFTAPVLGGAIGNGNYYYSTPPQAVVKRLSGGSDVAYLFWRTRDACRMTPSSACDGRDDTTIGEMDLATGSIRFVEDHKNAGTIRVPTDEQGQLAMVGDVLFHSHWMSMGAIRIPDRTTGGGSFGSPIPSTEYMSISNTVEDGECPGRNPGLRYCPTGHSSPTDVYQLDPGFYIYHDSESVYDNQFKAPVRTVIYDSGVIYWRSNDGAIIALAPTGTNPPTPSPSGTPVSLVRAAFLPQVGR